MNILPLWIFVIALVTSTAGQDFCGSPPGGGTCDCTTTANTVVCSNTFFTTFPSVSDFQSVNGGTINELTINTNTGLPSTFDSTTFAGKGWDTNLQQLRINSIGLQTIDSNGLTGLSALLLLDISSNNDLTSISTSALTPVGNLQTIALGNSQLTCCNWPGAAAGAAGIIITGTCIDSTGNAVSADPSSFNYASCITTTSASSITSGGFFSRLFGNGNFWWLIPAGALILSQGFTTGGGIGTGLLAGGGGGLIGGAGGGLLGGAGSGLGALGGGGFSGLEGSGFGGLGNGLLGSGGFEGTGLSGGFGGGLGGSGIGGGFGGFDSFGSGGVIGPINSGGGLVINPGGINVGPVGNGELGFSSFNGGGLVNPVGISNVGPGQLAISPGGIINSGEIGQIGGGEVLKTVNGPGSTVVDARGDTVIGGSGGITFIDYGISGPSGGTFVDGGISETVHGPFVDSSIGGTGGSTFIDGGTVSFGDGGFGGVKLGNGGAWANYNGQWW